MKFTITNDNLHNLLAAATAVQRSPDPIQIIAERIGDVPGQTPIDTEERPAETGRVRVIAYNESMVSEWRCPAEIKMTGVVSLEPGGLDRLVKASRKADSTFTLETIETDNDRSLRLSTSRSAHEFPAVSGDVFNVIAPGRTAGKRANLANLAAAITTAKIAAAARGETAGGRVMLTGVHIRARGQLFDIVGTDAKRLAITTLRASDLGGLDLGDAERGITIPPESLSLVTDMLNGPESCLEVIGNDLIVENAEGSLSVRLIDLPYPDYTRLLGAPTTVTMTVPRASLDMALQRSSVALARDKRSVAVKLSHGPTGIYITSSAAGQSSSECVSEEPGDDVAIGFDARYMQNAISAYGAGSVTLEFSADMTPIRITSKNHPEIQMLVMPCKIA